MEFHRSVTIRFFLGANHFSRSGRYSKALTECLRGVEKKQHSLKKGVVVERKGERDVCGGDNTEETVYFRVLPMVPCSSHENPHCRHPMTGSEIDPGLQLLFYEILLNLCLKAVPPTGSCLSETLPSRGLLRGMGSWFLGDKRLLYCPTWTLGLGEPSIDHRAF